MEHVSTLFNADAYINALKGPFLTVKYGIQFYAHVFVGLPPVMKYHGLLHQTVILIKDAVVQDLFGTMTGVGVLVSHQIAGFKCFLQNSNNLDRTKNLHMDALLVED